MSYTLKVTVWCDRIGCHEHKDFGMGSTRGTRDRAEGEGWRFIGKKALCPLHAKGQP